MSVFSKSQFTLGPWLEMDARREEFVGASDVVGRANQLLRARVSPDGNTIVMCGQAKQGQRYSQYENQIWILNRDGELRPLDSTRGWAPCWSPDGKRIVFASDRGSESGKWAIFVASPDGATVRQLTPFELNAGHPTWSPDGKWIAFFAQLSADKKARGLALVDADG